MLNTNNWTLELFKSLRPIASGLPQASGIFSNASLSYSVEVLENSVRYRVTYNGHPVTYFGKEVFYTEQPDNQEIGLIKDENGNYSLGNGTRSETRTLSAQLYERRPRFQPKEGMDQKSVYFEGRLVNPLRLPAEINAGSSRVQATINGVKGTFTFRPSLESPQSIVGSLSDALGEPISGFFQVDTQQ